MFFLDSGNPLLYFVYGYLKEVNCFLIGFWVWFQFWFVFFFRSTIAIVLFLSFSALWVQPHWSPKFSVWLKYRLLLLPPWILWRQMHWVQVGLLELSTLRCLSVLPGWDRSTELWYRGEVLVHWSFWPMQLQGRTMKVVNCFYNCWEVYFRFHWHLSLLVQTINAEQSPWFL